MNVTLNLSFGEFGRREKMWPSKETFALGLIIRIIYEMLGNTSVLLISFLVFVDEFWKWDLRDN